MSELPAIGARVVVRARTGRLGPSGGPELTDVIGRLLTTSGLDLSIEDRNGAVTTIRLGDVVALKQVPDRPLRRRGASAISADDLTSITSRGWPPVEVEQLGDWILRAAGGFTGRANSVAVIGSPAIGFDAAAARVVDWYASRSMPPLVQVVSGSDGERHFLDAGWRPGNGARDGAVVQVADLLDRYDSSPEVQIDTELTDAWLALYGRVDEDPAAARAVIGGPATVGFARIGDPIHAIARIVVTGEWAGISAVEVLPEHRRQGWAKQLVHGCLAWAVQRGADKAYLQTMRDNTAALALYEPFGFVTHHEYRYLQAPSPSAPSPT